MKKTGLKIVSWLVCIMMLAECVPTTVFAEEAVSAADSGGGYNNI